MRTRIKVMDLSLAQWDWLQTNVPTSFDMAPGAVRMCVEFELTPDFSTTHVEMPVRAFMTFMERLALVEQGVDVAPMRPPVYPVTRQDNGLLMVENDIDLDLLDSISEFPSVEGPPQ